MVELRGLKEAVQMKVNAEFSRAGIVSFLKLRNSRNLKK